MAGETNTITKIFGVGAMYAVVPGLTPVKIGVLQDVQVDVQVAVAELYGQNQFPVAIGRGKGKITGKAKTGQVDVNMFNTLFWGGTVDTTQYRKVIDSSNANAGASIVSIAVGTLGSSYANDLGIYYASNGVQLSIAAAASLPATTAGTYFYTSSNGTYTMSSLEASSTPFNYAYDYLSTGNGNQLVAANNAMGVQPAFSLELFEGFTDPVLGRTNFQMKLLRCVASKFALPLKNEGFLVSDFEFACYADSSNNVFQMGVGA